MKKFQVLLMTCLWDVACINLFHCFIEQVPGSIILIILLSISHGLLLEVNCYVAMSFSLVIMIVIHIN